MESEHVARCRECALSLENVLSDSGPNEPIHSLASAKLRFLKHCESLGQGQKVQTSYDSPPSAADRPKFSTAGPSQEYSRAYSCSHSSQMKASFEVYCVLQLPQSLSCGLPSNSSPF